MADRGPQFDNPRPPGEGIHILEKLRPLIPREKPLDQAEIFAITKERWGLRSAAPRDLPHELKDGVMGDFVVISNIASFLRLKSEYAGQGQVWGNEIVKGFAIYHDKTEMLDGLDTLPEKYDQALKAFLKEAFMMRTNIIFHIGEKSTLREYFDKLSSLGSAYILVDGNKEYPASGYDIEKYYGFGKNGRAFIDPRLMIDHSQLKESDIKVLKDRYEKFLDLPVETYVQTENKRRRLADVPDQDIVELTRNKVLRMIREKLGNPSVK